MMGKTLLIGDSPDSVMIILSTYEEAIEHLKRQVIDSGQFVTGLIPLLVKLIPFCGFGQLKVRKMKNVTTINSRNIHSKKLRNAIVSLGGRNDSKGNYS